MGYCYPLPDATSVPGAEGFANAVRGREGPAEACVSTLTARLFWVFCPLIKADIPP